MFSNENFIKLFIKIINHESKISLRSIDWFCEKYSKDNKIILSNNYDVNKNYNYQLQFYSKKYFDVFARYKKNNFIYQFNNLDNDTEITTTTIGQLNMFYWLFENGIIEYIDKNIDNINRNIIEHTLKNL